MTRAEVEHEKQFPYTTPEEGLHRDGYLAGWKRRGELDIECAERETSPEEVEMEIRKLDE